MTIDEIINDKRDEIRRIAARHGARNIRLFGSAARGEIGPDSDIDVLVEFEQGHSPGLSFFSMQSELTDILGRKVELHTPNFLSRYFRDRVLQEAEVQYGQH